MTVLDELLGESAPMVELRRRVGNLLRKVSGLRELPPILIQGETGTGKTTLARLIHQASARAGGPFVDINCAEFQESLLESQLFGHERHTFTGAGPGRAGLFQAAHRGVLLLDEIGEMSMALQAKLLKVLDDGAMEVRRVGSTRREVIDVAVVAATHADLRVAVEARRFRQDLYNRLAGLTVQVPALRERGHDVELLAEHFLRRACEQYHLPPKALGDDTRAALQAYTWPGNVRELGNVIRRAVLESELSTVTARDLGLVLDRSVAGHAEAATLTREGLLETLSRTQWNITQTAAALGVTRNTIRERIKRYDLQSPRQTTAVTPATVPMTEASPQETTVRAPAGTAPAGRPSPAEISPAAVPRPSSPSGVRWSRRRLTLLRARVRSTAEVPLAMTARVLQAIIERAQSFGGRIECVSPTGVVAVFGLEPDEDAPRRAGYAGLAIMNSLEQQDADDRRPAGLSIAVGLHVTQMLLAELPDGTVRLDEEAKVEAWRTLDALAASSAPGVALSDMAAQFLGRRFEIVRHMEDGRMAAWLVGRVASNLTFAPTEFVGRQRELMLLEGFLEHASEGHGQLVAIVGEPGIGKSRLVHEFIQALAPEASALLRGHCVPYGVQVPYHVVLDVLHSACGIQDTDTAEAIDTKVRVALDRLGRAEAAWAPYVLNLLCPGRDPIVARTAPEAIRERTFDALQELVVALQERQPLILVIEDLHWIDTTSAEWLAVLSDVVVRRRVLILCTSRPGYPLPWAGRSHASQIALPRLPVHVSRRLVVTALGGHPIDERLVTTILTRGEGNPFFLEELLRALRHAKAPTPAGIPETVHDLLSARILRLPDEERQILQLAAVIGGEVPQALLEVVSDLSPGQIRASLSRLQTADLLYSIRVGRDAAYTFNHALTRDVANEIMLDDERRALHARVVAGIERRYDARLIDHVERLAEHAERGALWETAIDYNTRAARKASAHSAYRDAVTSLERALAALEHMPAGPAKLERGIDLRFKLRSALVPLGDLSRAFQVLSELGSLTEELGDLPRKGLVLALMTGLHVGLGQFDVAAQYGERARAIAVHCGDATIDVIANSWISGAYFFLGDNQRSIECAQHVADLLPLERSHESFGVVIRPAVYARGFLSWALSEAGRFEEAEGVARDALEMAEASGHPVTMAAGLLILGTLSVRRGDVEESVAALERAHDLCRRYDIPLWSPTVAAFLGYALVSTGRFAEGEVMLQAALEQAKLMRVSTYFSQTTMWLGEARLIAGAITEAEELASVALEATRERHEAGLEAWALRLVAEVTAYRDPVDVPRAEALYRDAMQRAEARGLRPLLARCLFGLGRLYRRAGQCEGANTSLTTAACLFGEMQMRRWSDRAGAELRLLETAGGGAR